jgi:DNA-binding transcriptional MerR regulator
MEATSSGGIGSGGIGPRGIGPKSIGSGGIGPEGIDPEGIDPEGIGTEGIDRKGIESVPEQPLMKIGEIAAFFNVSVKAIRIYEKKGIIVPAKIDPETGYRYYSIDQVQTLNALIELKTLGFSLSEIKEILVGGINKDGLMSALARKRAAWQDVISAAENKIAAIDKITERMSGSKEALKLQELTDEQRAWLLAKMVCVEDLHGQNVLSEALWL